VNVAVLPEVVIVTSPHGAPALHGTPALFDPIKKKESAKAGCAAMPAKSRTPIVKKYLFMILLRWGYLREEAQPHVSDLNGGS